MSDRPCPSIQRALSQLSEQNTFKKNKLGFASGCGHFASGCMSPVGVVSEYGGSHAQVCGRERPTRGKARVKGGNGTSHSGKRGGEGGGKFLCQQ